MRATPLAPRTTDESSSPSDACSNTDFTIHWPSAPASPSMAGVAMSACRSSFFAATLCDVVASACAEQPVNGTPSDSSSAGTRCSSRPRPSNDSTRLKTAWEPSSRTARSTAPRSSPTGSVAVSKPSFPSAAAIACASTSVSLESGRPASAAASCNSAILGRIDASRGAAHDLADQRAIAHAGHLGHVRQVGIARREPGERIDLEHLRAPLPVEPDVDAPRVAAPQAPPSRERDVLDLGAQRARVEQAVLHDVLPLRLVPVRIDAGVRAFEQHDLEGAERPRIRAGAEDADRELAAAQVFLDDDGLAVLFE